MIKETLTIPNHKQLDTGACRAILKQASQYIPLSELSKYFYDYFIYFKHKNV
ncbi:type II toxin-antitoxin system HicA family toxin [Crocosphaera sp.]|uniref:type II toxin-antitoxin system HicA family toxin n=1 Tax=Crocosphaera sp. TaxID=2729996 RepID=UPI0026017A3C|nr:type II toxin-antitoxin system HicA family toxin [Crocosphaera sp.]MDJ0582371.1 type II toxin-antitoxin system HicA family toxin [Crocosphaera sp.]